MSDPSPDHSRQQTDGGLRRQPAGDAGRPRQDQTKARCDLSDADWEQSAADGGLLPVG